MASPPFALISPGYNSAFGDFTHAYLHNTERKATATVNGYPSDYGSKMSYFGRLNYDFKETYMFSAIIRADGSSKFAKGNQWGYFPSFSAGWVISNEAFMKNTASWLGFLKVRAGWGQNGNDNIPNSNWRAAAHSLHLFLMILPSPPHVGQVVLVCMVPSMVCWLRITVPLPLQVGQVSEPPSPSAPVP